MTKFDKETIARRIRGLLSKTEENGATEHEAMAAAMKAKALMDEYQLDMGALEMEAEGFEMRATETPHKWSKDIQYNLAYAVQCFTETKSWTATATGKMTFYGYKSDVLFAEWLLRALEGFIVKGCDAHLSERKPVKGGTARKRLPGQDDLFGRYEARSYAPRWNASEVNGAREAFLYGACARISERLKEMVDARNPKGTGLVISKKSRIDEELERMGFRFKKSRALARHLGDEKALRAGTARGDAASFNRPVNDNGETVRMIASR